MAASLALVWPAAAQAIDASDAAALAAKIQSFGYQAELQTDSSGDPLIQSGAEGITFQIYFYGCQAGKSCKFIQFSKCWDKDGQFPLATANEWNRNKNFGRASVDDEGDPCIDMTVNLSAGGVVDGNLRDTLQRWSTALSGWREMMGP